MDLQLNASPSATAEPYPVMVHSEVLRTSKRTILGQLSNRQIVVRGQPYGFAIPTTHVDQHVPRQDFKFVVRPLVHAEEEPEEVSPRWGSNMLPISPTILRHDFTMLLEYNNVQEAAQYAFCHTDMRQLTPATVGAVALYKSKDSYKLELNPNSLLMNLCSEELDLMNSIDLAKLAEFYPFPEITWDAHSARFISKDNAAFIFYLLLRSGSYPACIWFYHCRFLRLIEGNLVLRHHEHYIESVEKFAAHLPPHVIDKNHRDIQHSWPRGRFAPVFNWKCLVPILLCMICSVEARELDKQAEKTTWLVLVFCFIFSKIPWATLFRSAVKGAKKFVSSETPTSLDDAFMKVRKAFDVESLRPEIEEFKLRPESSAAPTLSATIVSGLDLQGHFSALGKAAFGVVTSRAFEAVGGFLMGIFTAPRVSEGASTSRICMNYASFSAPFLKLLLSVGLTIPVEFHEVLRPESGIIEPTKALLDNVTEVLRSWAHHKETPLGRTFTELAAFALIVPALTTKVFNYKGASYNRQFSAVCEIIRGADCSITGVIHGMVYMARVMMDFCVTGTLNTSLDVESESLYVQCKTLSREVVIGTYGASGITSSEISAKYEMLGTMLDAEIAKAPFGVGKSVLEERKVALNDWKAELDTFHLDGSPREQPFGVFLFGPPGAGKTTLVNNLCSELHERKGIRKLMKVNNVIDGDKFQSSGNSATTCWIVDDLGIIVAEMREAPAARTIFDKFTSVYQPMLKADVGSKGKTLDKAHFVIITSNTRDANVGREASCYRAVIRRVGVQIEVIPKPEYLDKNGNVDPSKLIPHATDLIPSWNEYRPYTMLEKGGVIECQYLTDVALDNYGIYWYIMKAADKHWVEQGAAMKRALSCNTTRCEHNCPATMCGVCTGNSDTPEFSRVRGRWQLSRDYVENPKNFEKPVSRKKVLEPPIDISFLATPLEETLAYKLDNFPFDDASENLYSDDEVSEGGSVYVHPEKTTELFDEVDNMIFVESELREEVGIFDLLGIKDESMPPLVPANMPITKSFIFGEARKAERLIDESAASYLLSVSRMRDNWSFAYCAFFGSVPRWVSRHELEVCIFLDIIVFIVIRLALEAFSLSLFALIVSVVLVHLAVGCYTLPYYFFRKYAEAPMHEWKKWLTNKNATYASAAAAFVLFSSLVVPVIASKARASLFPEAAEIEAEEEVGEPLPELARPWIAPIFSPGAKEATAMSMTFEQAEPHLKRAVRHFVHTVDDRTFRSHLTMLDSHIAMMPAHAWCPPGLMLDEIRGTMFERAQNVHSEEHTYPRSITMFRKSTYFVEGADICLTLVSGQLGSSRNLSNLLQLGPSAGTLQCKWVCNDPTFSRLVTSNVCVESAKEVIPYGAHKTDRGLCFTTENDTFVGSCGSPIIHVGKGISIVGLYVAGGGPSRNAVASQIYKTDYVNAQNMFREMNLYLQPTERAEPVLECGSAVIHAVPSPHIKNPVMFQLDPGVVVANVERKITPRARTQLNVFLKQAEEHLGTQSNYKIVPMNFNRVAQPIIANAIRPREPPPPELLKMAADDFFSVIDQCFARCNEVLCPDGSRALDKIRNGPLSKDEIINGIEGNKFCKAMNKATSAGMPWNTGKKKILEGKDGKWYLSEQLDEMVEQARHNLIHGLATGTVANASLKSEPRKVTKNDDARLFLVCNLPQYIIVSQSLGPMMQMISHTPDLFETVIGENVLSSDIHPHVEEFFNPERKVSTEDYAGFDHNQQLAFRRTAARIFVIFAEKLGWSAEEVLMVEKICCEYLEPLVNMGGVIIETDNLQPSGCIWTAHLNGIVNSLVQRASFILHYPELVFRDHVHLRTLGDDVWKAALPSVSEKWTPAQTAADVAAWGFTLTPGNKSDDELVWMKNSRHAEFLKRKFFYNEDFGHFVGVLDPVSLMRPTQLSEATEISAVQQQCQIAQVINLECLAKGREESEIARERLRAYVSSIGASPNFDSLKRDYDENIAMQKKMDPGVHPNKYNAPTTCPEDYLHFVPLSLRPEAGEDTEIDDTVTFIVGEGVTSPDVVCRVYLGELPTNLIQICKGQKPWGQYTMGAYETTVTDLYYFGDGTAPTVHNLVKFAYLGIRGGIVVTYYVTNEGSIFFSRGFPEGASFLTNPNQAGVEILDSRVNPSLTINHPCYLQVRFFLTQGSQLLVTKPTRTWTCMSTDGIGTLRIFGGFAEDTSLIHFRGFPLLAKFDRRRNLRPESGELTEGLTDLVEPPSSLMAGMAVVDPSRYAVQHGVVVEEWMERLVPAPTFDVAPGARIVQRMYPMQVLMNDEVIRSKLRGWSSLSLDIKVYVEVSASSMHAGKLLMSAIPYGDSQDQQEYDTVADNVKLFVRCANPNVDIDIGSEKQVVLTIPYTYDHPAIGIAEDLAMSAVLAPKYNPVLIFDTVVPVSHQLALSTTVLIQPLIQMSNVILSGQTALRPESGEVPSEKFSSKTAAAAANMLVGASVLQGAPALALPLEVAGAVMSGISGVARLLGHSRPMDLSSQQNVPRVSEGLTCSNTNSHGHTLAMDANQGVSIDGILGGNGMRDETLISDLISKPYYIMNTQWLDTHQKGTVLLTINVGPQIVSKTGNLLALAPGGFMCTQFATWNGAMEYELEVVCAASTGGSLLISYDPEGPEYLDTITKNRSMILNIKEKRKVRITVNWNSYRGVLATCEGVLNAPSSDIAKQPYNGAFFNGALTVSVFAPLLGQSVISPVCFILAKAWCSPRMVFGDPSPRGLNGYKIYSFETQPRGTNALSYENEPTLDATQFAPMYAPEVPFVAPPPAPPCVPAGPPQETPAPALPPTLHPQMTPHNTLYPTVLDTAQPTVTLAPNATSDVPSVDPFITDNPIVHEPTKAPVESSRPSILSSLFPTKRATTQPVSEAPQETSTTTPSMAPQKAATAMPTLLCTASVRDTEPWALAPTNAIPNGYGNLPFIFEDNTTVTVPFCGPGTFDLEIEFSENIVSASTGTIVPGSEFLWQKTMYAPLPQFYVITVNFGVPNGTVINRFATSLPGGLTFKGVTDHTYINIHTGTVPQTPTDVDCSTAFNTTVMCHNVIAQSSINPFLPPSPCSLALAYAVAIGEGTLVISRGAGTVMYQEPDLVAKGFLYAPAIPQLSPRWEVPPGKYYRGWMFVMLYAFGGDDDNDCGGIC